MKFDQKDPLGDDVLHPIYLPFSASTLSRHFAPVRIHPVEQAQFEEDGNLLETLRPVGVASDGERGLPAGRRPLRCKAMSTFGP